MRRRPSALSSGVQRVSRERGGMSSRGVRSWLAARGDGDEGASHG